MRYAKMLGRVVGYMPHSPDIAAEEHKITEANAGKKISQRAYNRHFRREQALLSLSDFVVFPSYNASTAYRSRFSTVFEANKKVYYLESGVDVPEIDPNLAIPEVLMRAKDRTVVLFAGRYNSHKGYDLFCQAAEVFGEESDFCFFSAGGGPIATPDGGVVTDLGWQPNIHSILPHVDIVVIPNRIAYYDLWPLECAAFAKGLVMTAVGGSRDQLLDLPDTVSVGRASPRSIELGIREAKSELDKNKSWGALNKEAYLKKYTSRLFARRWSNTIEKIYSDYDSRLSKLQR
ncbi:MAG: glycosyltransferase [Pseudomonadota bacterium]